MSIHIRPLFKTSFIRMPFDLIASVQPIRLVGAKSLSCLSYPYLFFSWPVDIDVS